MSTTPPIGIYDRALKKGRKVSKYLGKLDKKRGFIPKGQNKQTAEVSPRNITEYGNSMLLHAMLIELKPLFIEGEFSGSLGGDLCSCDVWWAFQAMSR